MRKIAQISLLVLMLLSLVTVDQHRHLLHLLSIFGFLVLTFEAIREENKTKLLFFICLTVLFIPWLQITLGILFWKVVYILLFIYFSVLQLNTLKKRRSTRDKNEDCTT